MTTKTATRREKRSEDEQKINNAINYLTKWTSTNTKYMWVSAGKLAQWLKGFIALKRTQVSFPHPQGGSQPG